MSVEQTLSFVVGTVLHVMRFFFLCFSEHTFHPCASFPLPTYSLLNSFLLLQMIFAFDGTPPSLEGNDELCPPSLRMLINDCWAQDPQQRPSFRGVNELLHIVKVEKTKKGRRETMLYSIFTACLCVSLTGMDFTGYSGSHPGCEHR